MNRDQAAHIANWLTDLATLTAGNAPIADAKAKVTALTGMLANEYPPEAFTPASLQHVARACTFFPSYGELVRALSAWWKANRDTRGPPRIAGTRTLSHDDQTQVTVWLKRRNTGDIHDIVTSLSMLRDRRPEAFAHLVATDDQCRRIAQQRGWTDYTDPARGWDDPDAIRGSIAKCNGNLALLRLGACAVAKLAPQHLGLFPPHVLQALRDNPDVQIPAIVKLRNLRTETEPAFSATPGERNPREQREEFDQPSTLSPEELRRQQLAALGFKPAPQPMTAAALFEATRGRKMGQLSAEQIAAMRASAKKPAP